MEKLIELLNEYENRDEDRQIKWRMGEGDEGEKGTVRGIVNDVYMGWVSELVVCSNRYGFIKWLVENEKIDFRKLSYKNIYMSDYGSSDDVFLAYNEGEQGIIYIVDYYESLLMLLSIQDEPIEFLISILK